MEPFLRTVVHVYLRIYMYLLITFQVHKPWVTQFLVYLCFVFREKMAQAYDFALDKIGMDIMSYQLWSDYIGFLKSV